MSSNELDDKRCRELSPVAVNAFAVVVELNVKRRENDVKITTLLFGMKHTMEVLCRHVIVPFIAVVISHCKNSLESIPGEEPTAPSPGIRALPTSAASTNNTSSPSPTTPPSLRARLETLVEQTATDIKACANTCDAYAKKRLLTKVLRSSVWSTTFEKHVAQFAERRTQLLLELVAYGSATPELVRRVGDDVAHVRETLEMWARERSVAEKQLRAIVEKSGGVDAVLSDEALLKKMLKEEESISGVDARSVEEAKSPSGQIRSAVDQAKEELTESTLEALERNREVFMGKFKLQEDRIVQELNNVVRRESDRIIEKLTAGPQAGILDKV